MVQYHLPLCPNCGSADVVIQRDPLVVELRYQMHCKACGKFVVVEQENRV